MTRAKPPRDTWQVLTPIPHVVKLRLTPATDDATGGVVWSLGLLVSRVESRVDDVDDGAHAPEAEHPFEIGLDLSTRDERWSYDDEQCGTLSEVLEVARWM